MSMRAVLILLLTLCTAFPQGTVVFHNRSLTDPVTGAIYNAPFPQFCPGDTAQLYLVTGTGASATYTPLFPTQTFRDPPNNVYFIEPVLVAIPGAPAGTTGVRVVVRAWKGEGTYDSAFFRGQSSEVVLGPLGGIPASGPPITPPTLDGLSSFYVDVGPGAIICVPEPSTLALALLGVATLAFRRKPFHPIAKDHP